MKSLFTSNVNWLIFLLLGALLLFVVVFSHPENKYPAIIIGSFLLGMGIFSIVFPERRLLWLRKDRVDLLAAGFVGAFIIFTLLLFFGQLIG